MSKFITFNGVDFFNSDKIEKISVKTNEKRLENEDGSNVYLEFIVIINGNEFYISEDFKINCSGYDTPNGYNDFKASINNTLEVISKM